MKPILKWTGGKTSELPIIKKYMPDNIQRYVEPFLGGGAVFFNLENKENLVNDFNKELINFYTIIQNNLFFDLKDKIEKYDEIKNHISGVIIDDRFVETAGNIDIGSSFKQNSYKKYLTREYKSKLALIEKIKAKNEDLTIDEKNEIIVTSAYAALYYMIRENYNLYKNTEDWFVLREWSYSGMFRYSKIGDFNVPYGGMSYNKKIFSLKMKEAEIIREKDFYKNTEFNCGDFELFFEKYNYFDKDDFIFLDPPYDSEFSQYNKEEDFDKESQRRLANAVDKLNGNFMMVIKKTDFICDLYKEFKIIEFDKKYMVNFHNRNNQDVIHLMITNY